MWWGRSQRVPAYGRTYSWQFHSSDAMRIKDWVCWRIHMAAGPGNRWQYPARPCAVHFTVSQPNLRRRIHMGPGPGNRWHYLARPCPDPLGGSEARVYMEMELYNTCGPLQYVHHMLATTVRTAQVGHHGTTNTGGLELTYSMYNTCGPVSCVQHKWARIDVQYVQRSRATTNVSNTARKE